MFLNWKNQYCEHNYTTQSNLQIQCNPYQITNGIFHKYSPWCCKRVGHDLVTKQQFKTLLYGWSGEGNGTPLQYSCLENPMGRGAW